MKINIELNTENNDDKELFQGIIQSFLETGEMARKLQGLFADGNKMSMDEIVTLLNKEEEKKPDEEEHQHVD